jgi:nucleotide-binding universal stress UspA family protein
MATEPFVGAQEYYQYVLEEAKKLAEGYAKKAELMARKRFPNASISIQVVKGKPAQMLVEIADERKADMIVVGSHGRGFWGRALLGSVSDAVVHHAGCSVLVIRKS